MARASGEKEAQKAFEATIEFKLFPREGAEEKADGFTIARAMHEDTGEAIVLKGRYGPCVTGQTIRILSYRWDDDPRYGRFCNVFAIDRTDPTHTDGLVDYFSSMSGVSRNTAEAIVEIMGKDVLTQLDADPKSIQIVNTTLRERVDVNEIDALARNWFGVRTTKKAVAGLTAMGLGDSTAARVAAHFEGDWEAVQKDPYLITDVKGVGFPVADQIGKAKGYKSEDPRRLEAGVRHILDSAESSGNICLSRDEMLAKAQLIQRGNYVPKEAEMNAAIDSMIKKGKLWSEVSPVDGVERIYTAQQYFIETRLYEKIENMLQDHSQLIPMSEASWTKIKDLKAKLEAGEITAEEARFVPERREDSIVTEEQWGVVENAFNEKLSILTGGPGTGKTSSLVELLEVMDREGTTYCCLAPTGKAAKRMTESTGREASTVHRRLGFEGLAPPTSIDDAGIDPDKIFFENVVIVDEASMVDMKMAERMLSHMSEDTHLVLVGDPAQLPAVGAGSVLYDLIESKRVPTTNLTKIFRQAENSLLTVNAHRISNGDEPYWTVGEAEAALGHELKNDWEFIEMPDAAKAADHAIELKKKLIKERGLTNDQVLITAPTKRGDVGTWILNRMCQDEENPNGASVRAGDQPLRVGDRVMNTKNRYGRGKSPDVMNGEIGSIVKHQKNAVGDSSRTTVEFEFGEITYTNFELGGLIPAYASTTHKLQGSEAPAIIAPIIAGKTGSQMLSRNLLYTAWTRASEKCVVIGDKKAIRDAIKIDGSKRNSTLDLRVGAVKEKLNDREAKIAQKASEVANDPILSKTFSSGEKTPAA